MFDLDSLIQTALKEDIGWGDITTEACVPPDLQAVGAFIAKEPMVICGLFTLQRVFAAMDERVKVMLHCQDGSMLLAGTMVAEVSGPARAILTAERTSLNILQRLSGIATRTREAVTQVEGTQARVCDTRKTTPGLRELEKYAVRIGGGSNHRMGLSDGVLIKDNHIAAAGSIAKAVDAARKRIPHSIKIEVETATIDDVRQALSSGADIIMFDNMDIPMMTEAVRLVNGRALTEASGNMGDKPLREVAMTGVDLISIGALTHTVHAADINLKLGSTPKAL
ncbi:MAG: carboxylating nicotinate-nucleotide diphosphorylase [Oscillospiraceae bacterium]|jgi:nicotinate-nucleotide pyrophosphorylase (carboxylating)|nr:carboxylating nicotinate-nucleotide diphosphorylase [Oscillospiraceae bacterium]